MIPVNRPDVLEHALKILNEFAVGRNVRGRFISLYLGLRRMRAVENSTLAELGSTRFTVASEIEQFLDRLYTKTHRPEPFVVLTAPFGGSTTPEAPYGARSGTIVPGRTYPTNTWRNNFGIQKGVGCPAGPDVIANLLNHPQHRLGCQHMALDPEGRHLCRIRDTAYRGEEHAIWLRHSDNGYQVVDLDHPTVVRDYLQPGFDRVPIFGLIGMIYCMAVPDVLPTRIQVGIPEFATDFGFTYEQIDSLFDCDLDSLYNASLATKVEDSRTTFTRSVMEPISDHDAMDPIPEEPHDAVLNTGVGAEIIVAKDLRSCGWAVRYRANQTGLGYDLEATRDDQTLRIEVKSSIAFANLELQESEWKAAQTYGDSYVLAVVDFYGTAERSIWYVRNPAANAIPAERTTLTYRFVRADVEVVKTEVEFL